MPTYRIVERLNVIKDIALRIFPCFIHFSAYPLAFEQLEQTFSHRVAMTVSTRAHTLLQVVLFEEILPIVAAELTALI